MVSRFGVLAHKPKTEATVERGIAFLLRAQISSGPYAGGVLGSMNGDTFVRIDYVQHALCAWLRYAAAAATTRAAARRPNPGGI